MSRLGARLLVLGVFALTGCVYFNGIYNAQTAAKDADALVRRNNESAAQPLFQASVTAAESVLARHPRSKWRSRALYLAGTSGAYGGQCDRAVPRLTEFLAGAALREDERDRARLALGACDVQSAHLPAARARLDSLLDVRDRETARRAHVWAARAALAAGDRDAVSQYLATLNDSALPWELVLSSLAAQEYPRVESLLVERAQRGDYRDDAARAVRELAFAGYSDGAERVVRAYDLARVRDASRAAMHLTLGDLNLRAERDTLARQHLLAARALAGRDTVTDREAAARLAYQPLKRIASLREFDSLVSIPDSATRRTTYGRRINEQLLLFRMFSVQSEPTGAARFLAAEVARDSLRALPLARAVFLSIPQELPASPFAAQALYAASVLSPDSAAILRARLERDYPTTAVAAWARGEDPATRPDFVAAPPLLTVRWNETVRLWSDSVRKLRASPRGGASANIRP